MNYQLTLLFRSSLSIWTSPNLIPQHIKIVKLSNVMVTKTKKKKKKPKNTITNISLLILVSCTPFSLRTLFFLLIALAMAFSFLPKHKFLVFSLVLVGIFCHYLGIIYATPFLFLETFSLLIIVYGGLNVFITQAMQLRTTWGKCLWKPWDVSMTTLWVEAIHMDHFPKRNIKRLISFIYTCSLHIFLIKFSYWIQIYSGCDEAYRLNEEGNINVPPEAINLFCSGPCLTETELVLKCVDNIFSNFLFYNKATVHDIRGALRSGCSSTAQRGM